MGGTTSTALDTNRQLESTKTVWWPWLSFTVAMRRDSEFNSYRSTGLWQRATCLIVLKGLSIRNISDCFTIGHMTVNLHIPPRSTCKTQELTFQQLSLQEHAIMWTSKWTGAHKKGFVCKRLPFWTPWCTLKEQANSHENEWAPDATIGVIGILENKRACKD